MKRRLAAILVADVVGYSKAMEADEGRALGSIRVLREELFEPEIANYAGKVFKRLGDGWLVEFPSVVDAVNCAVTVQKNVQLDGDIELRIGVHIGDIVDEGGESYGDGINIAARLEAIGGPGLVLISDDVKRQVGGKISEEFHDLGFVELKNIADPVRVWSWPGTPDNRARHRFSRAKPNVYVHQFESAGDGATELADAIRENLMTAFGRQSGLTLVTAETNANFVLKGSVRVSKDRWRITSKLDNRDTHETEWSDRIDETGDDLFDVQDRCITRIASAVRIRLPVLLNRESSSARIEEMSVEDLLNFSMDCHLTPTADSWNRAETALNLVLDRSEGNWMAMTMLSFNLLSRSRLFGWSKQCLPPAQRACELIETAVALKPDSEVARLVHGAYLLYVDRDAESARIQIDESLRLNPDYYHSINLLSQIELVSGRLDVAADLAEKAANCDPGYPYLHLYLRDLGSVLMALGEYAEASQRFQRADMAAPGLPRNLIGMIGSSQLAGNYDTARKAVGKLQSLCPDFAIDGYDAWPVSGPEKRSAFKDALITALSHQST